MAGIELNHPSPEVAVLEPLWVKAWQGIGAVTNPYPPFFELISEYEGRGPEAYHNLTHLVSMYDHLEEYPDQSAVTDTLILSIAGHDVLQRPKDRSYNDELESSLWIQNVLRRGGASEQKILKVGTNIQSTKHTTGAEPVDPEQQLLHDLDVVILGSPADEYSRYIRGVRFEYSFVSEKKFNESRRSLLRKINDQRIFLTEYFYQNFEESAHQNLKTEIKLLKG